MLCSLGSAVNAVDNFDNSFLRRKRIESPSLPRDDIADSSEDSIVHAAEHTMEDLWEQAASAAQVELEVERLLQRTSPDYGMSMPTPSRPPNPRPTPPPVPRPTPAPDGPTASPVDCLNGRTREEYLFDLLSPITSGSILNDPSTPQGMAFDYLVNDDPHLDDPCSSTTIEQRYGLLTLYFSTQGEEWIDSDGWLSAEQECTWKGVSCHSDQVTASRLILRKFKREDVYLFNGRFVV